MALVEDRNKLTKSENKICDYIEEYMNNSIYMTVTEIANGCGVGEATVTRFCRKLGFRSFVEFKMTMAQEFNNTTIVDEANENEDEDSIESLAKIVYNSSINFLESSFKRLNYKDIEQITKLILNANKIYFIGVGHSGMIAEESHYKFLQSGINSNYFRDVHTINIALPFIEKGDVMFAISHSGNTEDVNIAANIAKKNGAYIVSITNNLMSKLARVSDYVLSYVSAESKFNLDFTTSKVSQSFIIDVLYNSVAKENYDKIVLAKNKTEEYIKNSNKEQNEI